jgi:putative two-component system response regulator
VRALEHILNEAGYLNLSTTMDSSLAVSMFNDDNPDLVLLDLASTQQDGYEVLRNLRALVPKDEFLPIVVLTRDFSPESRRRALVAGATDFLSKPVDETEVALHLENLLRTRFLQRELQKERAGLEQRVRERTRSLERMIAELRCAALPIFAEPV